MIEIGFHPLWAADEKLHEGCGLVKKTVARPAAISASQVRLEIPVEVLVRVALRRVGRQVEHLYLVRMRLHPGGHLLGMVRPEVVKHQEHLVPFAVLHEPLHEAEGRLGRRCAFEELEASLLAKMGDAKDQTVIVRIPYNLQVQDLVDLLQIGVKNNLKFVIATDKK